MSKIVKRNERIPFQIKLQKNHHDKLKLESEKLSLTMSAFVWLLIETYKNTDVNFKK